MDVELGVADMVMMPQTDFQSLIADIVRDCFTPGAVRDVEVWRDIEQDGEGYFRVMLVMNTPDHDREIQNMVGLGRHIRARLAEVGETDFLLVDYVTAADAMKLKRARG